ncbi:MAG: DUF6134 family protein [Gemmataceae bacterium]|nr:DUF6134 family protein [Gemmataceae bacterium]
MNHSFWGNCGPERHKAVMVIGPVVGCQRKNRKVADRQMAPGLFAWGASRYFLDQAGPLYDRRKRAYGMIEQFRNSPSARTICELTSRPHIEYDLARSEYLMARSLLAVSLLLDLAGIAAAYHVEQRCFAILVDGKEVGQSRMTIVEQDDGAIFVAVKAKVEMQRLLLNYSFTIEGQEWWKEGKLIGLRSSCNNNGTKCDLLVTKRGEQLRVRVNGQDRFASPDLWTSSYWKLADARFHNKQVPILAVENGQERLGQLQYLGPKQLPCAGQLLPCFQFRVTAPNYAVELWYDQHHRLVRQEFVEAGQKTIVQLVEKK